MNNGMIGIVIVNYNGENYQNECILSILKSSYDNYRIIVVDNMSTDNSMSMLEKINDDRIIKIYEKENWGVAKGNNIGIRKSKEIGCQYTLLLNNDTVLERDTIKLLVEKMKTNLVVVPLILFYNTDKIWYGGGRFVKYKCVTDHINIKKKRDGVEFKDKYDYAPTCCMLINNSVFNEVGYMDENYFVYFDDSDFCMRLKMHKIVIGFCKESVIYHKVSMSTGGKKSKISAYYENRNRYYFYKKYKNYFPYISFLYLHITRIIKYVYGEIKNTNDKYIKKAIKDYYQGKMGKCLDL